MGDVPKHETELLKRGLKHLRELGNLNASDLMINIVCHVPCASANRIDCEMSQWILNGTVIIYVLTW